MNNDATMNQRGIDRKNPLTDLFPCHNFVHFSVPLKPDAVCSRLSVRVFLHHDFCHLSIDGDMKVSPVSDGSGQSQF